MRITVVGGYGYTGRLICLELVKKGFRFSIAGKDKAKLDELVQEIPFIQFALRCNLNQVEDVKKLLDQSDLLINCVGPFEEESSLLLEWTARTNKIYLDITGELLFTSNSFTTHNDVAKNYGATIIHGCAFESMLVDLALLTFKMNEDVRDIKTFYLFNDKRVSPGTKKTYKLFKYKSNLALKNGHLKEIKSTVNQYQFNSKQTQMVAVPFPLPEIAYVKWRNMAKNASSYLLLSKEESLLIRDQRSEERLAKQRALLKNIKPKGPTDEQRKRQISTVYIKLSLANDEERFKKIVVEDMYGTTANAMIACLEKLLNMHPSRPIGVVSPAALFVGEEKETLLRLGVEISDNVTFSCAALTPN